MLSKQAVWEKTTLHTTLACDPLEFVTLDILGTHPKTLKGKHFVMVIKDSYKQLTRAAKTFKNTDAHNASLFMNHWVVPYGSLTHMLKDNRTQSISQLFESIYVYFGTKHMATMMRHPRKPRKAGSSKKDDNCKTITLLDWTLEILGHLRATTAVWVQLTDA